MRGLWGCHTHNKIQNWIETENQNLIYLILKEVRSM